MGEQASERAWQERQRERPPVAEPGAFHSEPVADWSDYGRRHHRRRLHHANGDSLPGAMVLPYGDVSVRVNTPATTSGERTIPFDGGVHVRRVIVARVISDEILNYVRVNIVCDGSVVWVRSVALHCYLSVGELFASHVSLNHTLSSMSTRICVCT